MFELTNKIFIGSNHNPFILLTNQKCMIQPNLINLHPNEYIQEFHYYPFPVKLDRCVGSCNTLNNVSNKLCIPTKTKDLNRSAFNMITGINELETLIEHIWYKCKCRFDRKKYIIQINGRIITNVDVSVKTFMYVKKIMFGILLHVIVKKRHI